MLILSSLHKYKISDIKTFVESLNKCGFNGRKFMVVYECDNTVKTYLTDNGWNIFEKEHCGEYIVTKRFEDFANILLNDNIEEQVLISDCRDVYFDMNPELLNKTDLYIAQDGAYTHRFNKWATSEMLSMFPDEYRELIDEFHLCAGVFYGSKKQVGSLCKKTYEYTFKSKRYDANNKSKQTCADQMALNIVAYRDFKYKLVFNESIINMASTFWDQDINFFIYHQYDRIPNFWVKFKENKRNLI